LITGITSGQQWITKKYTYDSTLNVSYGTAINFNNGTDTLHLDIYEPACDDITHSSRRPLILIIHGGAFLSGNKAEPGIKYLCREFAKRGYLAASINYRLGFIADDNAWNCNYPNYACIFAHDTAEWIRAYYRGIQDAKGALRYLINRHAEYRIDTQNIFLAGESAGALIALGVATMDVESERPPQTFVLDSIALPNPATHSCPYNLDETYSGTAIGRPDLGSIDGTIEPTGTHYSIKGVGSMYGAMMNDLLQQRDITQVKPAIYLFHQPCDIVVHIDSADIFWGLTWCMTNGYNCSGIAQTPQIYGSRAIANWNNHNNYGYEIQSEFTSVNFPFNFLFGTGSCLDQVNNPCHDYDNRSLRVGNLAAFFAPLITTAPVCDTGLISGTYEISSTHEFLVYPNPSPGWVSVESDQEIIASVGVYDLTGMVVYMKDHLYTKKTILPFTTLDDGIYFLRITSGRGRVQVVRLIIH
jgi:hypothetical protein